MPRGDFDTPGGDEGRGSPSLWETFDRTTNPESIASLGPCEWLAQLRFRFDLAIEVLDRNLQYVLAPAPDAGRAVDIRVVTDLRDTPWHSAATSVLRSGKVRSFTAGTLRLRMYPLFGGTTGLRSAVGLLVLADRRSVPTAAPAETDEEIDRRLDAAGQWLVASVDATIHSTNQTADEGQSTERMACAIDMVETFGQMRDDRSMIALAVEALAIWYDADVRAYRQDFSGDFVLESWLPGVDLHRATRRLSGAAVWERDEVFQLTSVRQCEELGWDVRAGSTLFVPIAIGDSVEWLLTVSAAPDPTIQPLLGSLRHMAGLLLTRLEQETADRLTRRIVPLLVLGDAPFEATLRIGLETLSAAIGAAGAQFAIFADGADRPSLTVEWGSVHFPPAVLIEADAMRASGDEIMIGRMVGPGLTGVLAFRKQARSFTPADVRLAQSAVTGLVCWFAGTVARRPDLAATESAIAGDLLAHLRRSVDRDGYVASGGALAIVLPASENPSGADLDALVQVLQDSVRTSDTIGIVSNLGVGAVIPNVTEPFGPVLAERLSRAARSHGTPPVRVGVAIFAPASNTPEVLLTQAFAIARRGSAPF